MSEEAAAVAAPEAPTATPAEAAAPEAPAQPAAAPEQTPETPAAAPEQAEEPDTRASVRTQKRRAAHKRAEQMRELAEQRREKALEQPRQEAGTPEGGQFKKEESAEAESEAAAEAETTTPEVPVEPEAGTAAEAPAPGASTDETVAAEQSAPADGVVMIQLAEDHPYRARGITEWPTSPELERETRGMLNAVAERAKLDAEVQAAREREAILNARLKVQQSDLPYQPNPRTELLLNEIRQKYSPEEAELVLAGLNALNQQRLFQAEQGARHDIEEQRTAQVFVQSVHNQAAQRFPVWAESGVLGQYMTRALEKWGGDLDARNKVRAQQGQPLLAPDTEEFFRWAALTYAKDPAVQGQLKAAEAARIEKERERIRREEREAMAAAEKQKLEAAAERHATLPPTPAGMSSAGSTAEQAKARDAANAPRTRTERRRAIQQRFAGR